MTSTPIVSWFDALKQATQPYLQSVFRFRVPAKRPDLHTLYEYPELLPDTVRQSDAAPGDGVREG